MITNLDAYAERLELTPEELAILNIDKTEREALLNRSVFYRGYDYIDGLAAGQSVYWLITIPDGTYKTALYSREISMRNGGDLEFRIYANPTGVSVDQVAVSYHSAGSPVLFQRLLGEPTGKGTEVDLDIIPASGSNDKGGGSAGGQALRPQPADAVFLAELTNFNNTALQGKYDIKYGVAVI